MKNVALAKLLLCFLISASIWLVRNLTLDYPETETVPVLVHSHIEGRSEYASSEVAVTARCNTSGFTHIGLSMRRRAVKLDVDPSDFEKAEGDAYVIPSSRLYKYASRIFGESVSIESFASEGVTVRFDAVDYRKVPVVALSSITCRPQYMAVDRIKLSPDSVVIYADPSRLASIDAVFTRQLTLHDLGQNGAHGKVRLDIPSGVGISTKEVSYDLDVKRFVEIPGNMLLSVRNAPSDAGLTVLPPSLDVRFYCEFPVPVNPLDQVELFIDYDEFLESDSGHCIVRHSALPAGVIEMKLEPQVCECFTTR